MTYYSQSRRLAGIQEERFTLTALNSRLLSDFAVHTIRSMNALLEHAACPWQESGMVEVLVI